MNLASIDFDKYNGISILVKTELPGAITKLGQVLKEHEVWNCSEEIRNVAACSTTQLGPFLHLNFGA